MGTAERLDAELRQIFSAAVAACAPERLLTCERHGDHLALPGVPPLPLGSGRVAVVAAGKAATGMASVLARALGPRLFAGLVVAPVAVPVPGCRVLEAAHPLPDARSEEAARQALALAASLDEGDLLLAAISGGTSALMALPAPGLTLAHKADTARALLAAGLDVAAVNRVRRHLSAVKNGRLRDATRARVVTLVVADVLGAGPEAVGSAPTLADGSSAADALAIARQVTGVPPEVLAHLARQVEPPRPAAQRPEAYVIASPRTLVEAAVGEARRRGLAVRGELEAPGEDVEAAAARILAELPRLSPTERPALLVGVGEPTVRVRGPGAGGRSTHLALLVARGLRGKSGVAFLAAGSDGVDGASGAAGAVVDGTTWDRASAPDEALRRFDSGTLLGALGDLVVTGPTGTNLLDLHLLAAG